VRLAKEQALCRRAGSSADAAARLG